MTRVLVRLAVALGAAGLGVLAVFLVSLAILPATIGYGETAGKIFKISAISAAAVGALLSLRIPDRRLNLTSDDVAAPPRNRVALRVILLATGVLAQIYILLTAQGLGSHIWLPIVGLAAVGLGLATAGAASARPALGVLAFLTGTGMIMFLPVAGLGATIAPAALSLLAATLVPIARE